MVQIGSPVTNGLLVEKNDGSGTDIISIDANDQLVYASQSATRVYMNDNSGWGDFVAVDTTTKVQYQAKSFDVQNEFDNVTNYRFTATSGGKYLVMATISWDAMTIGDQIVGFAAYINGNASNESSQMFFTAGEVGGRDWSGHPGTIINLSANDFIDIRTQWGGGAGTRAISFNGGASNCSIIKVA